MLAKKKGLFLGIGDRGAMTVLLQPVLMDLRHRRRPARAISLCGWEQSGQQGFFWRENILLYFGSTKTNCMEVATPRKDEEAKEIKKLKFQVEIDKLKLNIDCSENLSSPQSEFDVFRWCHSPIEIEIDFLPNVLYDKIVGMKYDYSEKNKDEQTKCRRCAISLFTKEEGAFNTWSHLSLGIQQKLGYTWIYKGVVRPDFGLISEIREDGHLGFYEYENVEFRGTFSLFKDLNELSD